MERNFKRKTENKMQQHSKRRKQKVGSGEGDNNNNNPKEFANKILANTKKVYSSKKHAVDVCSSVASSPQIHKAHILSQWLLDTIDGSMIMGNAILRACADAVVPYAMAKKPNKHRHSKRQSKSISKASKEEERVLSQVADWERQMCDVLGIKSRVIEPDNDWTRHGVLEIFGNILYTLAFEPARLDVKTSWRWTSTMFLLCPWGREKPFHVVPVHDLDIRAKEALSGLIPSRAFTTTGTYVLSYTHYASTFRYNSVLNQMLSATYYSGRGRGKLIAAFLMLIVGHFRQFCLFPRGSSKTVFSLLQDKSGKERQDFHQQLNVIRAIIKEIGSIATKRAEHEQPQDYLELTQILRACVLYTMKNACMNILQTGLPVELFETTSASSKMSHENANVESYINIANVVKSHMRTFVASKGWM